MSAAGDVRPVAAEADRQVEGGDCDYCVNKDKERMNTGRKIAGIKRT